MARSDADKFTVPFLELSPDGLPTTIVHIETVIKAVTVSVFAKCS
ncbi:hypothetical protein [Sphingobacterium sp. UBA6320]|nr:hypothetical protein [Sphingobacterium sp. UBA6320]